MPGDAEQDLEGMQTMRTLARNMIFLMRSIALGKEKFGIPAREEFVATNFIGKLQVEIEQKYNQETLSIV